MCLYLEKDYKKKQAEEEIICYKVVCSDMTSPVMNFKYEVGKEYSLGKDIKIDEEINLQGDGINYKKIINNGFHSYMDYNHANFAANVYLWRKVNSDKSVEAPVILKCVIPKGSVYYEGSGDCAGRIPCYVSNRIKIVEILYGEWLVNNQ